MSRSPFDAAMAQMHRAMNATPEELEAFLRVAVESSEANTYVRDMRAEVAALRAVVARVEELADELDESAVDFAAYDAGARYAAERIRTVLGSTDSDPAATERQGEAEGAGDGV